MSLIKAAIIFIAAIIFGDITGAYFQADLLLFNLEIRPIAKWYDLWIGVFVKSEKGQVFIFPVPCFGVVISFSTNHK